MKLIDVVFVSKELKALDMTKSTGIDGIASKLVKASATCFSRGMTNVMLAIVGPFPFCQLS